MIRRACVAAAIVLCASTAHAYEFWLRANTIGQAYQLREYRLLGPDLFLGRRRITETLALRIYDIGDYIAERRREHLAERGLRVSWQSYLRIDHDFGDYTAGRITLPGPLKRDALDVIPELSESVASLDLMYGYVELAGLADDRLTVQLGRILADDGWGTSALDGGKVNVVAVRNRGATLTTSVSAGFRVRASSPLGVAAYELDGTSGAGCREYVEGATPGTGSWKLIDRNRTITNTKLSSDYEYCPQRDVLQPTIGVAVVQNTKRFGAELGYRRTWSQTVGLIGPVDRLDHPDLGLYPNDFGQAPSTGVNEEYGYARFHVNFRPGGFKVMPYLNTRVSLLHGVIDRADVGARLQHGDHVLEPALEYFYPTFDGDSIFNAFSIEPTTDARMTYQYVPNGPWRGTANAWLRHYAHEDNTSSLAGGVEAGVQRAFGGRWRGQLDALWDDGYGGRRIGGTAEAAWQRTREMWLRARAIVLGVREDDLSLGRTYLTSSTVLSSSWRLADRLGFHLIAEGDYDHIHNYQARVIGVLDLAFSPEP
ncbi:MAG: hypothetical protein JWO36_716 [Myxococcales bacterium]|nr:hypothetical protein [Myxococcales bacterium]